MKLDTTGLKKNFALGKFTVQGKNINKNALLSKKQARFSVNSTKFFFKYQEVNNSSAKC
jgi:hypothetical protein